MTLQNLYDGKLFTGNQIRIRVIKKNLLGYKYYLPFHLCFVDNLDKEPFYDCYKKYYIKHFYIVNNILLVDIYTT